MVNHYRWDFIGLSTDVKPTPATSERVVDGSTFYCSDNSKLYVYCKDQWYEKTATGGGTYELPIASDETLGGVKVGSNLSINSETGELSGNYSAFTGTDGEAAGTAGLVPAPATTDAGKFLKADGTWDTAGGGGGGVITLSAADYDFPVESPDGVALWKLATGVYKVPANIGTYFGIYFFKESYNYERLIFINNDGTYTKIFYSDDKFWKYTVLYSDYGTITNITTGAGDSGVLLGKMVIDNLTSTYLYNPLSANQGKVLNEKIEGRVINGNDTAPTTSTVGSVGTLYSCVNSGTPEIYMCTAVSGSTYTWAKVV